MEKIELNDFYNEGFGWICKHCEREQKIRRANSAEIESRLMREGEAESKQPVFSNIGLAKWLEKEQRTLMCPRCGITELAE